MKEIKFYTLIRRDGYYVAEQQIGWTDGTYNYYYTYNYIYNRKSPYDCASYHCILPDYGLAVTWGLTLEETRQKADALQDKIEQALKTDYAKDMLNKFEQAKAAANHNQTNDGKQNNNK